MDITQLLDVFDRTSANLAKLEAVWDRAKSFIPDGPTAGSPPEYDDLRRSWRELLPGLPPIDGWTVTIELPDIDELGRTYIDYLDIGMPPLALIDEGEQPGKELAEYRFRLTRARRRAVRERLTDLIAAVDSLLPSVVNGVARDSTSPVIGDEVELLQGVFSEIERLMGDTAARQSPRWSHLRRHMSFGQGHDWHDIREFDWPSVRPDVEAAARNDDGPLPVPKLDLGVAASGTLTGTATSALPWDRLDDSAFERLLYDLLRDLPNHQNVLWVQKTRAADRGRDLSCERVTATGAETTRTERMIVQAKHWLSKSVGSNDIGNTVTSMALLSGPTVRILVFATSGTFTSDALSWVEQHNEKALPPYIELWAHSHLESLLASRPAIAAAHGLR